ncbi:MAG: hypothetical protein J0L76_04715 [Rhodobacterales bacterium]|nr:hypothetical protein [Rhodobacterales bacterium]
MSVEPVRSGNLVAVRIADWARKAAEAGIHVRIEKRAALYAVKVPSLDQYEAGVTDFVRAKAPLADVVFASAPLGIRVDVKGH